MRGPIGLYIPQDVNKASRISELNFLVIVCQLGCARLQCCCLCWNQYSACLADLPKQYLTLQDHTSLLWMTKSSPFRGVTLFRPTGKWRAQVSLHADSHHPSPTIAGQSYMLLNAFRLHIFCLSFHVQQYRLCTVSDMLTFHLSRERSCQCSNTSLCMCCQISALGRTVSLGDHDTEEEAARAFDRAIINKGGRAAKTNFPMTEYEAEVAELTGKVARKTSHSLLFV